MAVAERIDSDAAEHVQIPRPVGGDQVCAFSADNLERESLVCVEEEFGIEFDGVSWERLSGMHFRACIIIQSLVYLCKTKRWKICSAALSVHQAIPAASCSGFLPARTPSAWCGLRPIHRQGSPWNCIHSSLRGVYSLVFEEFVPERMDGLDCVFLGLPSGEAMRAVPALQGRVGKIIDLGGDFRLADAHEYERYYGRPHTAPELLGTAVYGLPELYRERIRSASIVAIPDAIRQVQSWACSRH